MRQRGLIGRTASARIPSHKQSAFTSRREQLESVSSTRERSVDICSWLLPLDEKLYLAPSASVMNDLSKSVNNRIANDFYKSVNIVQIFFLPDDRQTASLVGLRGEWRHAMSKFVIRLWIQSSSTRVMAFITPPPTTITIDQNSNHTRFSILSFPNNKISRKSPFAIFKVLQEIGEPKSVKKMRSGDLLVETTSAIQSKSYLCAKTFLDSPLLVTSQNSLNSSRGVISEPDILCISEAEILKVFSDQSVVQYLVFNVYRLHIAFIDSSSFTSFRISSIKPTVQIESQLPEPISATTTVCAPDNSINTSASSLLTEIRPFPTTSNKFATLSTEVQPSVPLPESVATTSNSKHSNASNPTV
ncbi:uncharacterized protein TNCV_4082971 [Trichonephila clavipes]|nr:uncharacterized protein TNCV_4082971 [Trichonephila clavipes]